MRTVSKYGPNLKMTGKSGVVVGLRCNGVSDVATTLRSAKATGFDYLVADNIVNERYASSVMKGIEYPKDEPYSWYDMSLKAAEWQLNIAGVLSSLEQYLEGDDDVLRHRAQALLQREIEYTQHIGLPALIIELQGSNSVNLARIINSHLSVAGHNAVQTIKFKFWLKVPLAFEENILDGQDWEVEQPKSSWNIWNQFRSLCNFESRLVPVLEIPVNLPGDEEVTRWLGEPVKCIFISPNCFTTNNSGFPVLPKKHQEVVKLFLNLNCQVVINCDSTLTYPADGSLDIHTHYRQYIDYLYSCANENCADPDEQRMKQFTAGYEDYLQSPLQPLQDNLESNTYEVFEKDPVKYELYRKAVYQAILDLIPENEKDTRTLVLMVVGAGRGPLVRSSLLAAAEANRMIRVYAVEKNLNAVNTLLHRRKTEWVSDDVTIVCSDMREWLAPELADIIVSELLGSFGDNELSPECLDGAQKFLKPNGVMLPQSYTSYVSPIMSSKLYNEARRLRDVEKNQHCHFETPYVVNMKNRYEMAHPQKAFTFTHPRPDPCATNDRFISLSFKIKQDTVLHGFCGYFESTLYGSVIMSILPESFSDGMFSWFPIYFPLRDPIQLKQGDDVKAQFWRCSNKNSVWYEWNISSPVPVPIHNPCGRSYTIGL